MIKTIESRSNEKIKSAQKLAASSRFRNERREFFLEGARLCFDAAASGITLKQVFFTESCAEKYPEKLERIISSADEAYKISRDVASKLADTQSSQGVFTVCAMPQGDGAGIKKDGKYILLENIQDPANLGAIARTAEALGIDGAVLCGCCDVYNPKAQRAAMGSLLRLPLIFCGDAADTLKRCVENGMLTLAATPDKNAEKITDISLSGGVIAVIGNEGNGVTEETMAVCRRVTIPMKGRAESLNASMAAALVMWEMMRQPENT